MNFVEIRRFFKLGIIAFCGFHGMVLIMPVLLPLMLLLWVVSRLSFGFARLQLGKPISKPDGMDVVNGKENAISRPFITIAFRFTKRNPDVERVRRRFQEVVLNQHDQQGRRVFAKFTQIFKKICGYHVWTYSENFDLKNHIRLFDSKIIIEKFLRERSVRKNTEDDEPLMKDLAEVDWETILKLLMSEVGIKPMKEDHPNWEILILPETENRYTTLFRVHHSITDGLHFVRLIAECLADTPVKVKLPYRFRNGNILRRMLQNLCSFSFMPYCIQKLISCNDKNPLHGPKLTGRKIILVTERFPISLMKDIKKVVKVTINDIIFSCVSYALEKHYELRKSFIKNTKAIVAINLREHTKPLRLKNDYAPITISLPTSSRAFLKNGTKNKKCDILIENDSLYDLNKSPSLSRLQSVKSALNDVKTDPCLMSITWMLVAVSSLLPARISEYILATKGITLDISNIQGPQTSGFIMNEAFVEDITFWLPDRDPLGIGVSITSYNGSLRVGLTVDEALMNEEEGNNFLTNFRQEISNLGAEIMMLGVSAQKMESEEDFKLLSNDIP